MPSSAIVSMDSLILLTVLAPLTSTSSKVLDPPSNLLSSSFIPLFGYILLLIISIAISLVGTISLTNYSSTNSFNERMKISIPGGLFVFLSLFLLIGFTFLLRLGTLRLKRVPTVQLFANSPHQSSELVFNHREMDELIFEVILVYFYTLRT